MAAADRIEFAIDAGASRVLAAAVANAAGQSGVPIGITGAVALAALLGTMLALRQVGAPPGKFVVPEFACGSTSRAVPGELGSGLTGDTPIARDPQASCDELVLDDILGRPDNRSGVVRLFDPAAMAIADDSAWPAGQPMMNEPSQTAPPDASQALYDALADLRRSLR